MSPNNNKNSSPTLRCAIRYLTHFTLFITVLLPVSAMAADKASIDFDDDARWFQVELILFSHQTDLALDAEQWPDIDGLKLPEKLLELHLPDLKPEVRKQASTGDSLDPTADTSAVITKATDDPVLAPGTEDESDMPVAYQILPDDQRQLADMVKQLDRSANRDVLLHIAWQQPTYDRKHATPVYFSTDMAKPLPANETENAAGDLPTPEGETLLPALEYASEEDLNIGPIDPQFVGTVTLSVERYLHIATDLLYRRAVTQHSAIPIPDLDLWYDRPYPTLKEPQGPAFQQNAWQAIRGFQHKESRRMRSTEIHYLDHPFMGMVVVITPVELPEPAEEIQQTSPQNILLAPSRVRKVK